MSRFVDVIPARAKCYVLGVSVVGLGVLFYCVIVSFLNPDLSWLFLACMTVVASFFPVRLPLADREGHSVSVTVSDIFIFTAILLYSPAVAVTVSSVDGFLGSFGVLRKGEFYKPIFNLAQLSLATFIVGHVFYRLSGALPPLDPGQVRSLPYLFINLGFCALLYFVLNSSAIALALSFVSHNKALDFWKGNLLWASLTNFAGASAAAVIFLNFERTKFLAVGIAIPIMLVIYYAYKTNLDKISQANSHVDELNELYHSTISALAMAIDAKDRSTHGHVHRVQALAVGLAKHCGVQGQKELDALRAAALLHDIGKLAVPEHILNKPSPLTDSEMREMQVHPVIGADILDSVSFPYPVVPVVKYHHERWDGSGYPEGLKQEEIPLGARILAIADCYDALRSDRPYRPRLSRNEAIDYIKALSNKAYDPALVKDLVANIDELESEIDRTAIRFPRRLTKGIQGTPEPASKTSKGEPADHRKLPSTGLEADALLEMSRSMGRSLSVPETLSQVASKIQTLIPFKTCSIYLLSAEYDRVLSCHASGDHADLLKGHEIRIGDGVSGWVAAQNQPLFNVAAAPDFKDHVFLSSQYKGCLVSPLAIEQNVMGVISLYSEDAAPYDSEQLSLMGVISHYATVAISNAMINREIQEDAYTDELTSLPNFRYFKTFIDEELEKASRMHYPVTILMMDLEFFKDVNDRFGHKVGDWVLVEFAHTVKHQLRKTDTCLRYAGDEFIAVLPGVDQEGTLHTIQRIQDAVQRRTITVEGEQIAQIGVSIGSATFPVDGRDPEELLSIADRAMYENKLIRTRGRRSSSVIPFSKSPSKLT